MGYNSDRAFLHSGCEMMELIKIKGNSYYIPAPTNIGVYVFKNKNCLLVDSGINNGQARKIEEALVAAGLHPRYILNTHSHMDHIGGNHYFQSAYPGCQVLASATEKYYMQKPELHDMIIFSAMPLRYLEKATRPFEVDTVLEIGLNRINDEKFTIIPLYGHTLGQVGVITPDRVCFTGDAVFCRETIDKYSLPYLFEISQSIATLKSLRGVEADAFVLGHAAAPVSRTELLELIDLNLANIDRYVEQILELLQQPLTREDLLEHLTVLNDLQLNLIEYHLIFSTISAFIKHLYDLGEIDCSLENGRLFYYRKS